MEALLKDCGCDENTISKFEEEGIDEEAFNLLNEGTLTLLVPKIGPRLKLLKKLEEHKSWQQVVVPVAASSDDDTLTLSSSESNDHTYMFEPDEGLNAVLNNSAGKDSTVFPSESYLPEMQLIPFKSLSESPGLQKLQERNSNLFPGGLENLLKKSIDGKLVLAHKERLNNDLRQKLCKEIINHLLSICDECTSALFSQAAAEICKIFTNESEDIYFIPYRPKKGNNEPKQSARGKLWSRYINVRSAIKTANATNIEQVQDHLDDQDEHEDAIAFEILKTLLEPQTKILQYWEKTYEYRRKQFKNKNISVSKIFEEISALKLNQIGPDLIASDFNQMYPERIDNMYLKFPMVAQAIKKESAERKICVVQNNQDVDQQLAAVVTLPYLFAPVSIRTSSKSTWRPSKSEVAESFVINIRNFYELEELLDKRRAKLKKFNLTIQPFLVILGALNNPESYYVCIDEVKYSFDSLLRAFETLFKLFHALDIRYPAECQHIWTFIEEIVFELRTSRRHSAAAALVADLQRYLS